MTRTLSFTVHGQPAPQGSKKHVGNGVMVEASKAAKPWRQDVVAAAHTAIIEHPFWEPFAGAVKLTVTFHFTRPKSHYRSGKHAHELKPSAPEYVASKPDIDKVVRATCDALTTAGVWRDDNLAAVVKARKIYATSAGADIEIKEITQ